MTLPSDDRRDLRIVVAAMHAAPGKRDELRQALEGLIPTTVAEDGCVSYALHQGSEDPDAFFFYENWESDGHLDAHLSTPQLAELVGRVDELLDERGLSITRLHRIA